MLFSSASRMKNKSPAATGRSRSKAHRWKYGLKSMTHLGTAARSLPELVKELGQRRFGRVPRVGDAFCGGGSIPFEKLSGWSPLVGKELVDHVFADQALNTLSNHGVRAMIHLESSYMLEPKCAPVSGGSVVETSDGRGLQHDCEFLITDPPYADAVNYHELAEFFLGWSSGGTAKLFPTWSRGSRRPLAVTGSDENFRRSMVCLPIVAGAEELPSDLGELWQWVRNPLPPAAEDKDFAILRRSLNMDDSKAVASGSAISELSRGDQQRLAALRADFGRTHNPFIRHIVRRERKFLEEELNPETGLPWLEPVRVELIGERQEDALQLTDYLGQAQQAAEDFATALSQRVKSAGFLKTLLLRRMGSTIRAGYLTAKRMLETWGADDEDDADEENEEPSSGSSDIKDLTPAERAHLEKFVAILEATKTSDPKYDECCGC